MENDNATLPKIKFWYPRIILYDVLKSGSIDGVTTHPHDKGIIHALNSTYYPNSKVKGIPENTVFIARLNKDTTENDLKNAFSQFGKIIRCRLVKDIVTGFSLGYGFIEYEKEREAFRAVKHGDGLFLDGRKIYVDHECERLLPGWKPRRLGGGFGGRKESGQLRFGGKDRPFKKPIYLMKDWEIKNQYEHNRAQSTKLSKNNSKRSKVKS